MCHVFGSPGKRRGVHQEGAAGLPVRPKQNLMHFASAAWLLLLLAPAAGVLPLKSCGITPGRVAEDLAGVCRFRGGDTDSGDRVPQRQTFGEGIVNVLKRAIGSCFGEIVEVQESRLRVLSTLMGRDASAFIILAHTIKLPRANELSKRPDFAALGTPMETKEELLADSAAKTITPMRRTVSVEEKQAGKIVNECAEEKEEEGRPKARGRPKCLQQFPGEPEYFPKVGYAPAVVPPNKLPGAALRGVDLGCESETVQLHGTFEEYATKDAIRRRKKIFLLTDNPNQAHYMRELFGEQMLEQTLSTCTDMIHAFDAWLDFIKGPRGQLAQARAALESGNLKEEDWKRIRESILESIKHLDARQEKDRQWMDKRADDHFITRMQKPTRGLLSDFALMIVLLLQTVEVGSTHIHVFSSTSVYSIPAYSRISIHCSLLSFLCACG